MADQGLNTLFRRESKLKTLRKDPRSSKGYGGKTEYKGDVEGERKLGFCEDPYRIEATSGVAGPPDPSTYPAFLFN